MSKAKPNEGKALSKNKTGKNLHNDKVPEEVKPAGPTKKQIVAGSSWTGKLPVSLLHEHCQRSKWGDPQYDVRPKDGQWLVAAITISKKNPKNNEVTSVRLSVPESYREDGLLPLCEHKYEARNVGAVYGLHRVSSHKSLQHVLPPQHRGIWLALEKQRKEDISKGKDWLYQPDPFKAKLEYEARKSANIQKAETKQTTRGITGLSISDEPSRFSNSIWNKACTIDMSQSWRSKLQGLIRNASYSLPRGHVRSSTKISALKQAVKALGFRAVHVDEAFQYVDNEQSALEWLLLFVPEDDLPASFLPQDYRVGITASNLSNEQLSLEYAARRIASKGHNLEIARTALEQFQNLGSVEMVEAAALQLLQCDLCNLQRPVGVTKLVTRSGLWIEERESLEVLIPDTVDVLTNGDVSIKLISGKQSDVQFGEVWLELKAPSVCNYPEIEPCISFRSSKPLPAYIKLKAIHDVAIHASELRGDMMLYEIYCFAKENFRHIYENPGSLRDLAGALTGLSVQTAATDSGKEERDRVRRNTRSRHRNVQNLLQRCASQCQNPEYQARTEARRQLPASGHKTSLVAAINSHQIVVVTGETGSGKSTQIPQFILEDASLDRPDTTSKLRSFGIVCTQPRRISAIGLAERVAHERASKLGLEVGYAIRGESRVSEETAITFCTTGILLRRFQVHGLAAFDGISHILVDEVHERSIDNDFLLTLLREVLPKRAELKLVLMSATADVSSLQSYFGGSPHVHIPGRTFPVQDYYLDDLLEMWDYDRSRLNERQRKSTAYQVDFELVAKAVRHCDETLDRDDSILVFTSGKFEIDSCIRAISKELWDAELIPLHASLTPKEQRRVFQHYRRRKVVVSTNVAETSITIDDVAAVVDTGRVKELSYDPQTNFTNFQEVWASKAACKQRRGRAGRVKPGICIKTFSRNTETAKMSDFTAPEITKVSLEQTCLASLAVGEDPATFLPKALTPPSIQAISRAMSDLKLIGAISPEDSLTALGQMIARTPCDVRCAKLIIFGACMGLSYETLTIASVISSRSPFVNSEQTRDKRVEFAGTSGDLISDLMAVKAWDEEKGSSRKQLMSWCEQNCLSYTGLVDIARTRTDLITAVQELGLSSLSDDLTGKNTDLASNIAGLQALIATSFYPNICRVEYPMKKYTQTVSGAVENEDNMDLVKFFTKDNRVFLHPSSSLFNGMISNRNDASFASFYKLVSTSKPFIRDVTPLNAYGMLLFSGSIAIDTYGRGIVVDDWICIRAWPKIGMLVKMLRCELDRLMMLKFDFPDRDILEDPVVLCIKGLIRTSGHDY